MLIRGRQVADLMDLSQRKPLHSAVYDALRCAIMRGIIPVGERINEQVYSKTMNISRTPIRNAIKRLEAEGLLEHIPNYGVVVKCVTVADAEEIYRIRVALDTLAFSTAMQNMDADNYQELAHLLAITREAHEQNDVGKTVDCFSQFNSLIYRFAKMPKLEVLVEKLQQYLARFRDMALFDKNRRDEALRDHAEIYDTLLQKNERRLIHLITEHLNASQKFIIQEIEQSNLNRPTKSQLPLNRHN